MDNTLDVLRYVVLELGGDFYFEWPTQCSGWSQPLLLAFVNDVLSAGKRVYKIRVDGCMYGLCCRSGEHALLKRWTILTTDAKMHALLPRRCDRSHNHAIIQGRETSATAFYPKAMARLVAQVWQGELNPCRQTVF